MCIAYRASEYRKANDVAGGFVIFCNGSADGWTLELNSPQSWVPGCIAVDVDGNEYQAVGGNSYEGAVEWQKKGQSDPEDDAESYAYPAYTIVDEGGFFMGGADFFEQALDAMHEFRNEGAEGELSVMEHIGKGGYKKVAWM